MKISVMLVIGLLLGATIIGFIFVAGKGRSPMKKGNDILGQKQVKMEGKTLDIQEKDRRTSIDILNTVLADEFVLLVQTLHYHWNLEGPQFNDYHKLFDDQYHQIFEFLDKIAERVRAVDGIAIGSMAEILKRASLQEDTGSVPKPAEMVKNLLQQHEKLILVVRHGINKTAENNADMGSSNLLTDLIEKHEKMAWMLRSLTR